MYWGELFSEEVIDKSDIHNTPKIRQSKINSGWVAGPIGQMNCRPSV